MGSWGAFAVQAPEEVNVLLGVTAHGHQGAATQGDKAAYVWGRGPPKAPAPPRGPWEPPQVGVARASLLRPWSSEGPLPLHGRRVAGELGREGDMK